MVDEPLLGDVRALADRADRVASVCTGALVLAAAGLLDGYRATTHWASCDLLARRAQVQVTPDHIFVVDRDRWTSAGITAGIDLALAYPAVAGVVTVVLVFTSVGVIYAFAKALAGLRRRWRERRAARSGRTPGGSAP